MQGSWLHRSKLIFIKPKYQFLLPLWCQYFWHHRYRVQKTIIDIYQVPWGEFIRTGTCYYFYTFFSEIVKLPDFFATWSFIDFSSLLASLVVDLIYWLVSFLFQVYEYVAYKLTDWECLRTQSEHDNSLTIKLYLLQFVNYYSSIIYIAFFKGRFVGRPGSYNTLFNARQEEVRKFI